MNRFGTIGGLRSRNWRGEVHPPARNTFSGWITARWALPERVRQRGPQRDFKIRRAPALPGLALSIPIHRASTFCTTWSFGVHVVSSHFSQVRASSHLMHHSLRWQTSQLINNPLHRSELSLNWKALRLHVSHQHHWSFLRTDPGVMLTRSHTNREVGLGYPRGTGQRPDRALYHRAPLNAGFGFRSVEIPRSWRLQVVPASRRKLPERPVQIRVGISSLSSNLQFLRSTMFRSAAYASQIATMVLRFQAGVSLSHVERVHRLIEHQNRILTLKTGPGDLAERRQHSQLVLQLRSEGERLVSRPAMQFAQPAASTQPELLSAIQRMETVVTKFQTLQAPASANGPDIQRLTAQVYDQFERQLRIERERRGR